MLKSNDPYKAHIVYAYKQYAPCTGQFLKLWALSEFAVILTDTLSRCFLYIRPSSCLKMIKEIVNTAEFN